MRDENGRRTKADATALVDEARDRAKNLREDMKAQPTKYSPGMRRMVKDDVPALAALVDALAGEVEGLRREAANGKGGYEAMAARYAEGIEECASRNRTLSGRVDELEEALRYVRDFDPSMEGSRETWESLAQRYGLAFGAVRGRARAVLSGGEG